MVYPPVGLFGQILPSSGKNPIRNTVREKRGFKPPALHSNSPPTAAPLRECEASASSHRVASTGGGSLLRNRMSLKQGLSLGVGAIVGGGIGFWIQQRYLDWRRAENERIIEEEASRRAEKILQERRRANEYTEGQTPELLTATDRKPE